MFPARVVSTKNKHLLVIYSIPTRGFTAAVSVFMGTPPAKPFEYVGKMGMELRRSFCPCAALDRSLQPATGMRGPFRLAHSQNSSPPPNSDFSDRLFDCKSWLKYFGAPRDNPWA